MDRIHGPRARVDSWDRKGGRRVAGRVEVDVQAERFPIFVATVVVGVFGTSMGWFDLASVHDNFLSMLTAMVVFAYAPAYLCGGSVGPRQDAPGVWCGDTGNAIYDFSSVGSSILEF